MGWTSDGRTLRAVLLGDAGVGKSSIVTSLIKETFLPIPESTVLPPVTIPGDALGATSYSNLTTVIVDTSPRREDRNHLENEVRKAQVVVIVYSIDDAQSFDRIAEYWLPTIRSLGVNSPVVLVGNKIDLRSSVDSDALTNEALEEEIFPIMQAWKEIETCVECSAKTCTNIAEIFYFAQRAVLYPTAPLYDSREHALKPACLHALRRIFKLCDADKDGILNNTELNTFQRRCFSAPLQQSELEGIKDIVRQISPDAIKNDGLTEEGFLCLHTLFIQKGRLETTWTALKRFGYGEDLQLKESFLAPRFDVSSADCAVELTPGGYAFFTELFELHDKDKDGALSDVELQDLFSTSPGVPWSLTVNQTVTNDQGNITLQGWLGLWSMTTLLNHRTTLAYLAYLGYGSPSPDEGKPTTSALQITSSRKQERKTGRSNRQVFTALLLGAAGSGKTTLMTSFVGQKKSLKSMVYEPTSRQFTAVNSVELNGAEKYLVLQEYGREEPEILRNSKKLAAFDVLIYVYDSSDTNSFSYISNLRQQYSLDHIPSIFAATKSDLDLAVQRHEVQPDVYCQRLHLRAPVNISWRQTAVLWQLVVSTAMRPNTALPGGLEQANARRMRKWMTLTAVGTCSLAVTWYLFRSSLWFSRGVMGTSAVWARIMHAFSWTR